jgi:hypothetical protein
MERDESTLSASESNHAGPVRDPDPLDPVINLGREALHAIPSGDPVRPAAMSNLSMALLNRFERTGQQADLDEAVTIGWEAVEITLSDHAHRTSVLSNLGIALLTRYQRAGQRADLDDAIRIAQQAIDGTPPDDPTRSALLSNLGNALLTRFERTGQRADLDEAITAAGSAVAHTHPEHPNLTMYLSNLSNARRVRFECTGQEVELDEAIAAARQSAEATAPGDPSRPGYLSNLSTALRTRFQHTGQDADLTEAITAARDAVDLASAAHSNRPSYLSHLGNALRARYLRTGRQSDIDDAVDACRQAVATTPSDHPDLLTRRFNLSLALRARFLHTSRQADLDEAVDIGRQTVDTIPPKHPNRPGYLSNFSAALRARYMIAGRQGDLDEAVEAGRRAAEATPPTHPNWPYYLSSLSTALRTRFERVGQHSDLDAAITTAHHAIQATPADHPDRPNRLINLSAALRIQFENTHEPADLDAAITAARDAIEATPADHPQRAGRMFNLSAALRIRFQHTGEDDDLDEALAIGRQALKVMSPGHPDRATALSNVGAASRIRFERRGQRSDLDAAIATATEAVEATALNHPDRAIYLFNLGKAFYTRFQDTGDPGAATTAIDAWRQAAGVSTAAIRIRIDAARCWAELADYLQRGSSSAVEGFAAVIGMMPLLAWRGLDSAAQEHQLLDWTGLASEAAACAITAGDPARALELLEQGRAVLWSQQLDTRTNLTALTAVAPELAARLQEVRAELDSPGRSVAGVIVDGPDRALDASAIAELTDRRMHRAREWDEVVERVQAIAGFSDFLRPPKATELCATATEGPVVVVNIGSYRCDALVITSGGVRAIPLASLTLDDVIDVANTYLASLHQFERSGRAATDVAILELAVNATLEWLWDTIAAPIVNEIGIRDRQSLDVNDDPWPRIWWCPTGALTVLPLHAAGYHDPEERGSGRTVLDRAVSSYTPTVRVLDHSRRESSEHDDNHRQRLLIVALRRTPGRAALPDVDREREVLTELFPADQCTLLNEAEATRQAVIEALREHACVHFACHGDQDLDHPSSGGLALQDGRLSIRDIAANNLHHGNLAFLSACKTVTGGVDLPDEAITLAAALNYAGYRHVIGNLWSVEDRAAADLTATTYKLLLQDGRLESSYSAKALHNAIHDIHDAYPHNPSVWSPFLHIGP